MKLSGLISYAFSISMLVMLSSLTPAHAQGRYAPKLKTIIGKSFIDEHKIPGLKGYSHCEGTLISDIDDPQPLFVDVLLKGDKGVVVMSQVDDTVKKVHYIVDVIEVNYISKGWAISVAGCQEGETEGQIIVALIYPGKGEYAKYVKRAWLCNRDKLRFQYVNAKHVKCLNVGGD